MSASKVLMGRQRGFSLIELLVGVVIGMLTVLVITQVMAVAEGKKRTVSNGSDAQVNGALALFTLQRDISQAGYGALENPDALGCTVNYKYGSAGTLTSFPLAPVVITDGASGAPDTITVLQANTTNFSAPMLLTGVAKQTDDHFTVGSSFGAVAGNMMISVPNPWSATMPCGMFSITTDASPSTATLSATNVPHVNGTGARAWNQSAVFPTSDTPSSSYLLNMGAMVLRSYTVSALGNMTESDLSLTDGTSPAQDVYPQIVNLQAMYGKDASNTGSVSAYDNVTPTDNAGWKQVLAIRVAVVARSNQYEKDIVTSASPKWDVGPTATIANTVACNNGSKCLTLDVSSVTDWQHYRYKVYDTIVPLRNMFWNK